MVKVEDTVFETKDEFFDWSINMFVGNYIRSKFCEYESLDNVSVEDFAKEVLPKGWLVYEV